MSTHSPPIDKELSTETADLKQSNANHVATSRQDGDYGKLQQGGKARWGFRLRLLGALLIPVFLETLDYTVVATAQPHIASQFNRLDLQGWIGTSYLLTSTVFLPLYGSLADVFGRHWALQSSLVIFMLGSALSTGAQNMPMMLAGRGIAGVGAAGCLSVVRVILADSRSLNENTVQTSMMIILYSVGYSVGPVIGGALTSITFRWVFAINLPLAALAMALLFVLLRGRIKGAQPSTRQRAREHNPVFASHSSDPMKLTWVDKILTVDFVGAFLFIVGGILLLLGLNWGSTFTWSQPRVIATLVVGVVLLIGCLVWENVIEHFDDPERQRRPPRILEAEPMLPIPIFRNLDSIICMYVALSSGMVMLVMFYFVAIFFTIVSGQSPTKSGLQLIYFAPGVGGGVLISTQLIKFLRQPKFPIIMGTLLLPVSLGLISRAIEKNIQGQVNGFMAMAGVSVGLTFGPIGIHARFSQPANRVAVIESLQLFFRTLGGTIGLAQCATVLNSKVKNSINQLIASGQIPASDFPSSGGSTIANIASINVIANLPPQVRDAVRDAYRNGARWAFISLIPWAAIACVMVFFLTKIEDTDKQRAFDVGVQNEKEQSVETTPTPENVHGNGTTTSPRADNANAPTTQNPNIASLGPKPTSKGVIGPISYVIYLVKKSRWESRKRKLEQESSNPNPCGPEGSLA